MSAVHALQTALAGEHAAVYVDGVVGGRVSVSAHPRLASKVAAAYTTHRSRRDQLEAMLRAAHATPVAADVSYRLPNPCLTAAQCAAAALEVEQRCAAVYADLVAHTSQAHRQWAIDALGDAAVRQLGFGGDASAFPGVAEV